MPVADGSVRIICDGTDLPTFDNDLSDVRVFAYDASGQSMAGWPVQVRPGTGSIVGNDLAIISTQWLTDTVTPGEVSHEAWVTSVTADGSIHTGTKLPMVEACCEQWAIGPDGIAYGTATHNERDRPGVEALSQVTGLDLSGPRAGWPVQFDGIPSTPAFGPDGRTVIMVGSLVRNASSALAIDRGGNAFSASSAWLPIASVEYPDTGGCTAGSPMPPIVAGDGTSFLFSDLDTHVYALGPSLSINPGWPFEPAMPLEVPRPGFEYEHEAGFCPAPATPAAGPDSTLYLALQARTKAVGGSIVAVGPEGNMRPGWPVELKRAGAEFWSVNVGSDGTVYALAIEPEAGGNSSASLLAIAPDSSVLYRTTIIDP
jgi:hypothetical protein